MAVTAATAAAAEHVDKTFFNGTIVVSFALCVIIQVLISPLLCRYKWPQVFKEMPWPLKWEWHSRIVSSIHATSGTILAVYALSSDDTLWNDTVWGRESVAMFAIACTTGYMIADSMLMPIYWSGKSVYIYWLHHGAVAVAFIYSMNLGVCQFFALFRLVSELSTPFANQRWFFARLGHSKVSKHVVLNGLAFSFTFILVRMLLIPTYWYGVWLAFKTGGVSQLFSKDPLALFVWFGSSLVLDSLNIYWSKKVLKGGVKLVRVFALHHWNKHKN